MQYDFAKLVRLVSLLWLLGAAYLTCFLLLPEPAILLPGGFAFSLLVLIGFGVVGSWLASFVPRLPLLTGQLIFGAIAASIHGSPDPLAGISAEWSAGLRESCLALVLLQAGLDLDIGSLKRMRGPVFCLTLIPGLAEIGIVALCSWWLFALPLPWALMLGAILSAASPAVMVPVLLRLQHRGYGTRQGVSTLIIAASSFDDVFAIALFGVLMATTFATGEAIWRVILQGPLELVVGLAAGVVLGYLAYSLWRLEPHQRTASIMMISVVAILGFTKLDFAGSGALCVIVFGLVVQRRWGPDVKAPVSADLEHLYSMIEVLQFTLVGATIDFTTLDGTMVLQALVVISISLVGRSIVTYYSVAGAGLTKKERGFVALSWVAKATVQASIGALPLDYALARNDPSLVRYGQVILVVSVVSILVCAPLGAYAMELTGSRWLRKDEDVDAISIAYGDSEDANVDAASAGHADLVASEEGTAVPAGTDLEQGYSPIYQVPE